MILAEAFDGHAGDGELAVPMPHEVMSGIAVLIVLGVILIVLSGIAVWLLRKIERRLRASD